MFEAFYQSAWQQPGLLVALPLGFLLLLPRRSTFIAVYLWVVTVETLLDAVLTSSLVIWPPALGSWVGLGFVLLGDARLFALTEKSTERAPGKSWLWRAALLTAVVPLAQAALIALFPELFREARYTYLAYECLFVLWLSAYRWALLRRPKSPASGEFVNLLTRYALGYYALWAVADLWILSGSDLGYALRVVPNLLYYGVFPLFVRWATPEELGR